MNLQLRCNISHQSIGQIHSPEQTEKHEAAGWESTMRKKWMNDLPRSSTGGIPMNRIAAIALTRNSNFNDSRKRQRAERCAEGRRAIQLFCRRHPFTGRGAMLSVSIP